ncbi:hypothetical protein SLEP1_g45094 [Rubroshorea leprosula]|uniref:Uncharacterized protein n=1 Tax=Rubroshorea leprosula TaxID=152421 RepID=A0AAV5LI64_9ROSI|nr:hypothetical protein SLEP1_g45094 [Rubroshorea leprosula]
MVYLKVQGSLNTEAEREKLKTKMDENLKQQEKLNKIMNASGYHEKVDPKIHEENMKKLEKLMQEFEFFKEESTRLE